MPNRRITIVLNANQSKRITVLIPLAEGPNDKEYDVTEHILQHARNKFHNKNLDTIYKWGGEVVDEGNTLDETVDEVLVSKGEAYIGPPKKTGRSDGKVGHVEIIADKAFVHEEAVKQLEAIAQLEGVYAAIGQPDLHRGDRFPIGCSVLSTGVYPALIGSDIGCGISIYPLGRLPARLTPEKLATKLLNRQLDGPWNGDIRAWLRRYELNQELEFDESLGTVGGGNHFAEICTVERVVDSTACDSLGMKENQLYLMVHTGSRGLGASILRDVTKSDANPYYDPNHAELKSYLERHDYAVKWAQANRDLVAHRIKKCLFDQGPNPLDAQDDTTINEEDEENVADDADPRTALGKLIDVTHNSVVRGEWKVDGTPTSLWIHRKGAVPSDQGFVPCPGSRGDFSWILQPLGDGQVNAHSLAHGAGRQHPRNAHALRSFVQNQHNRQTSKPDSYNPYNPPSQDLTITSLNSRVICTDPQLLIEERPEAYKSIQSVVDDLEGKGVAEGVCVLRPFVTYKVGDASGNGLSAREREREKAARMKGMTKGGVAEVPEDLAVKNDEEDEDEEEAEVEVGDK